VHGLQSGGWPLYEELFPGLQAELVDDGAPEVHDLSRLWLRFAGRLLSPHAYAVAPVVSVTRPHLEWRVRERVRRIPGVRIADGLEALGVVAGTDNGRATVSGVRVVPAATRDGHERVIEANLVVDATGRGSRMPRWLEELGYERPTEERLVVHIGYASQTVHLPDGEYPRDLVIEGRAPGRTHGIAVFACERGRWTVSAMSYGKGHRAPTDPVDRQRLADMLLPAWMAEALRHAEPLDDVGTHNHPTSVWRHYERLDRQPAGLVAFGDAIAAFNPIYGTGMTVAVQQGAALRTVLEAGTGQDLAPRFYRAAMRPLSHAWQLSTGADLAYPETEGRRTRAGTLMGRYVARVLGAAEQDPEVARRFLRVAGLLDPPSALLAPGTVLRVLRTPVVPLELPEHPAAPRPTAEALTFGELPGAAFAAYEAVAATGRRYGR
jgi:2-polyprenyl-6-methoxyphenol hydroxylase-like FAD-dependent oxidoreductase